MRNLTLIFLFCFIFWLRPCNAQEKSNVLKFNYLGVLVGSYTLVYERVLDYESSLQLSIGYRNYKFSSHDTTENYSGFTFVGEYRWYLKPLKRQAPKGLYIAPFVRYGNYKDKFIYGNNQEYNLTFHINSWAGGLMAGYQFLIAKLISVDIFLGPQIKSRMVKTSFNNPAAYYIAPSQNTQYKDNNGTLDYIRFGINVGVALK